MKRLHFGIPAFACVVLFVLGVWRTDFEADILSLLPAELPAVRGLEIYQSHFEIADETLLTLSSPDASHVLAGARSMARSLEALTTRVRQAEWQSASEGNPETLAALIAWQWINSPPETFESLTNRFQPDRAEEWFESVKEQMAASFSPEALARLGHDPFNLLLILPAQGGAMQADRPNSRWQSPDGAFRVIRILPQDALSNYRQCVEWHAFLLRTIADWQREHPQFDGLRMGLTGRPIFVSETASDMEGDMRGAALFTAAVIAVLFGCVHRRIKPLIFILTLLGLALFLTLAIGGWLFGSLNAISIGFAAILLGVTADYGLVLYQESKHQCASNSRFGRAGVGRGVAWSAVTTAAAFASLCFGGLPGMAQLGGLVAIGVSIGAVLFLFLFPVLLAPVKEPSQMGGKDSVHDDSARQSHPPRWAAWIVWAWTAALASSLAWLGFPTSDFSTDPLQPSEGQAHSAMEELQRQISGGRSNWMVVVSGREPVLVKQRLDLLDTRLAEAQRNKAIESYLLPGPIWPLPERQIQNLGQASLYSQWFPEVKRRGLQSGFTEQAFLLTQRVLDYWDEAEFKDGRLEPFNEFLKELVQQSTARDIEGDWHALGSIVPAESTEANPTGFLRRLNALSPEGEITVAAWDLLGEEVLGVVKRDFWRLLIPMTLLAGAALTLAFQSRLEVFLCLGALAFSGLGLLGAMSLLGLKWTLLNLLTVPLMIGLSVDYSIHALFSMRRHAWRWDLFWKTTGSALLLCAITTATGFGSLLLTGNEGLKELGAVCAVGIVCVWLSSVIALPVVFGKSAGRRFKTDEARTPARPSIMYGSLGWRAGLILARCLPAAVCRGMGAAGGTLYRMLNPNRESVVRDNLLPLVNGDAQKAGQTARRLFAGFGRKIADLWRFEAGRPTPVAIRDPSVWNRHLKAKERGKGLLLVTLHLGNWEIGGHTLSQRGERLLVLSNPEPDPRLTELRRRSRARWGVETLIVGEDAFGFLEVLRRLEENATVALLIDRPFPKTSVSVPFFGKPFNASTGAAELARATGCAVLPVAIVWENNEYVLRLLPEIDFERQSLREPEGRREFTARIMRAFEPLVCQHADQWYHFIPIWPESKK